MAPTQPRAPPRSGRPHPLEGFHNITFTSASMKDLDASAARLAGCLGFQTTASLRALFSSTNAATKRVIVDYIADRQAGFGIASLPDFPTKFRSIKAPTVIEAVDHAGRYTQVLLDGKPPTLASPNVTESNLFDIRQMWWNRQYMLTRVNDLAANSQLRIAPFYFDALETFLAWKVLIFFYTGFHRRRDFASANWHNVPAVAPTHVTSKANPPTATLSVPTSRVAQLENALARFTNPTAKAAQDDPAQLDSTLPDMISDNDYTTLVIGLGTTLDRPTTARLNRPTLSHADLSEALTTGAETRDLILSDDPSSQSPIAPFASDPAVPVDPCQQLTVSAPREAGQPPPPPPNSFELAPTYLKPWQVTALGWMHLQESDPLHGGILADACGLGKTLTALSLIWTTNRLLPMVHAPPGTFAPSLVLVPNALVDTWTSEIDKHFGDALQLILFFGSTTRTSDHRRKTQIVATLEELHKTLNKLSSSDSLTGHTIVLSSRQIYHDDVDEDELSNSYPEALDEMTTTLSELASSIPSEDPLDTARHALAQLQDADTPDEDQPRCASRSRYFATRVKITFARVICDEGHRVKTISSRQHQSVAHLQRHTTWFFTATPMWNKPFDFCRYLSLLWSNDFIPQPDSTDPEHLTDVSELDSALTEYTSWSAVSPLPDNDRPYHLLSPARLLALGRGGHLSTDVGFHVLPIILRLTCLAREPGHHMIGHNHESVTIGADIPPLAISTVELRYTRTAQRDHDKSYHTLARLLYGPVAESTTASPSQGDHTTSINWATYRQLCHIAVHPKLDLFLRNSSHSVLSADITSYGDWGDDRGFGIFFARTVQDRSADLPTSRVAVARYLAHDCPRLRFLLHLLWTEGTLADNGNRPRFLVYCNWPCTRWLVEMFLAALGLDFVVIRAGRSLDARTAAIQRFTNPNEAVQNYNSVFQTVGRIHRLGQTQPQKAWLLFQDHTIQRLIEHNSTRKILPQIAAHAPSRLDMGDHHELGLLGTTANGIKYSTRGAPMAANSNPRTPQKGSSLAKRPASLLQSGRSPKTPRQV
ncbi:Helicase C-terminal [Penicillium cf. griseofulvum]|uniref:Helicase C-terminal n=1 Tax=Penicillium cf. griseofulvum TaxID=2972120 RepID=A0A9W9MYM6_9EURO|nr:Helicase C-terminal [Penicillium cf. griseofulvum]